MEIGYTELGKNNLEFDYEDILDLFERNPELKDINKNAINIEVAGRK